MPMVLVSSRSFANIVSIGEELLTEAGFEVRRIGPADRPLDEEKMKSIVARDNPDVIISGAEPISANVLASSENLSLIMKHGVGVDNIDLDAATSLGIAVANAPGTNTDAVADFTIAVILSLLRHIVPAAESTKAGEWNRYLGNELGRQTVGVVGTGRIGKAVIRRLSGFGSQILAYDIYQDASLIKKFGVRYVKLEELLSQADVVTLHLPLLPETRNLLGREELRMMKKTAVLVNIARGELIDEPALAEALAEGWIAAAGLDVFAVEPPKGNPLLSLENVLATPHIAAYTTEAMEAMDRMCAETIIAFFAERYNKNILNPEAVDKRKA